MGFYKTHEENTTLYALEHGTLEEKIRAIMAKAMNVHNLVETVIHHGKVTRRETLVGSLKALTGCCANRIRIALRLMEVRGLGKQVDRYTWKVSKHFKTKTGRHVEWDGVYPTFSDRSESIYAEIQCHFMAPQFEPKDDDVTNTLLMKKLLQQDAVLIELKTILLALVNKEPEAEEKARKHLTLVKNDD